MRLLLEAAEEHLQLDVHVGCLGLQLMLMQKAKLSPQSPWRWNYQFRFRLLINFEPRDTEEGGIRSTSYICYICYDAQVIVSHAKHPKPPPERFTSS
jgi:hypothetical protein